MRVAWIGSTVVLAFAVAMAQAAPKDEVTEATKKLTEKGNYSWKQSTENAGGGGGGGGGGRGFGGGGPTEGKTADGLTHLSIQRRDNATTEVVLKGDKGAVKVQENWQSLAELAEAAQGGGGGQGGGGLGRFMANQYRNFKAPAAQAQELIGHVKEIKKEGDAYTGELSEEGVKSLMAFGGGRRGGDQAQGPAVSGGKGTAKFWVKDGALAKYEYNVQGKITFGDNEREVNRTTTVEIKDVGSTKVEVPADAKAKLS